MSKELFVELYIEHGDREFSIEHRSNEEFDSIDALTNADYLSATDWFKRTITPRAIKYIKESST